MKTIPSFQIDHNILKKGIYISRIDDDITTYDIRMRKPNREPVMTNAAMHTIEHLFATYVRNTEFGQYYLFRTYGMQNRILFSYEKPKR